MGDFFSSLEPLHVNASYIQQQTPVFPCECTANKREAVGGGLLGNAVLKCQPVS